MSKGRSGDPEFANCSKQGEISPASLGGKAAEGLQKPADSHQLQLTWSPLDGWVAEGTHRGEMDGWVNAVTFLWLVIRANERKGAGSCHNFETRS